ncbi:Ig-specific serine endopeptidase MIP [Mycoplasmopsis alligatoris]|uniref:Lipofamily protein n=1 Tax=Mycoplasmopsis alligatoris A21JP2 TaxID=747682 RepID=D4XWC7_9BACT|nr:DUF31 family protein [Mycoplasmopsis alligatoris]EFF41116.1 lipofamily protein [Mycoplasmopsis alligatoris A21JP2]
MKNKKLKYLFSFSLAIAPVAIIASCNSTNDNKTTGDEGKALSKDEAANLDVSKISTPEELEKTINNNLNITVASIKDLPEDRWKGLFAGDIQLTSDIKLNIDGPLKDKFKVNIDGVFNPQSAKVANQTGKTTVHLSISPIDNDKIVIKKKIELSGFQTSPFGSGADNKIPFDPADSLVSSEKSKYVKADQYTRFVMDSEKYLANLNRQWEIKGKRSDEKASTDNAAKYDKIAKELNLDTYNDAFSKGFTVPKYGANGNVEGLNINTNGIPGYGLSWVDASGRNSFQLTGLARTLPNEKYKQAALQTLGISFSDLVPETEGINKGKSLSTMGTIWIMDYELPENGKQPTKFYFGTNAHVAEGLDKAKTLSLMKVNEEIVERNKIRTSKFEERLEDFSLYFDENKPAAKVVFWAKDYLNSSPKEYLSSELREKFKDVEEMSDFAVIEIDFSKVTGFGVIADGKTVEKYNSAKGKAEETAKILTNNYAGKESEHVKFKSTSYLKKYEPIDFPLSGKIGNDKDSLYIVGYPRSDADYFLNEYQDAAEIAARKESRSLWVNGDSGWYGKLVKTETGPELAPELLDKISRGNYLSYQIGYRNFGDKPGLADVFITHPLNDDGSLYKGKDGKQYFSYGLNYMPRFYAPFGGSSGSSVRTDKNELLSVYYYSNANAGTGYSAAFRSEGFDYKGLYGKYNLEEYDLIYGGGKNQKSSYREELKKLYPNMKTKLFSEGLNKIPEEFKFKK